MTKTNKLKFLIKSPHFFQTFTECAPKIERTEKNNASDFLNIVTFHSKDVKSPPNGFLSYSRAAGMYEDIRTGPHHVFRIQLTLSQPGGQIMPTTVLQSSPC